MSRQLEHCEEAHQVPLSGHGVLQQCAPCQCTGQMHSTISQQLLARQEDRTAELRLFRQGNLLPVTAPGQQQPGRRMLL